MDHLIPNDGLVLNLTNKKNLIIIKSKSMSVWCFCFPGILMLLCGMFRYQHFLCIPNEMNMMELYGRSIWIPWNQSIHFGQVLRYQWIIQSKICRLWRWQIQNMFDCHWIPFNISLFLLLPCGIFRYEWFQSSSMR
jgi:hypothetical protein